VSKKKLIAWNNRITYARNSYYKSIDNGTYTSIVKEWDNERLGILKTKIKGDNKIMADLRLVVRLSKDYNVAEVEVSKIENEEEYAYWEGFARNKAIGLLESYPTKQDTPKSYTNKNYPPKAGSVPTPAGNPTVNDITTTYLRGKQKDIALKGINEGKYTLEAVNSLTSFDNAQALVFPKRY
jgi:hypothetical protein